MEEAGGFAAQPADIEEVSAFHGDNYGVLVHRHFIKDRAVMFELAGKLDLVATSTDDSVLAALEHAQTYQAKRRDFIPMPAPVDGDDPESGIAFASQNWRRAVTDRPAPSPPGRPAAAVRVAATARQPGPGNASRFLAIEYQ